jgi:hypothetical protein
MAYNLLPVSYEAENDFVTENLTEENETGFRNGISFDYTTGDFRRDGKNKILDSDGIESWKSWCINCLQTERSKHLAYSDGFGIDLDVVFRSNTREEAESQLIRQITEAIMADPYQRAKYVPDIEFTWKSPDEICAAVTIQGIDDVTIDIIAYITKGGTV